MHYSAIMAVRRQVTLSYKVSLKLPWTMSLMCLFTDPQRREWSGVRLSESILLPTHVMWLRSLLQELIHAISSCESRRVWNRSFVPPFWIRGIGCPSLNELASDVDMRWWWWCRSYGDSAIFIWLSKSGEERPTNKRTRDLRDAWDWWRHWQPTHCRPIPSGSCIRFLTSNYVSMSSQSAVNNAAFQQTADYSTKPT